MRRTIAAVGAAAAAGLAVGAALAPSARAATPASASATAALRYLYGGQGTDGSIAGSAGPTEDTVIGTADNGYDPATLQRTGGTSAIAYLAGLVSAGKVTTGGATAKLILAWVAAGKPAAIDGAALLARLDGAATGGGLLQPGGTFHATDAAVETANTFTQALAVLANVAMEHALPANATGWLVCAARSDGGFGYAITDTAASPPASCGDTSSDTNDTAIAVQALEAAGVTSAGAAAAGYLHGAQQSDGGFGFDASGPSDPDSDAGVIQAIVSLGQDPTGSAWTKGGVTPLANLAGFETPAGSGAYEFPGSPGPNAFTTSEVPAALALVPLGAPVHFTTGSSPLAAATPSPSAAATPTPARTPAATPRSSVGAIVTAPSTGGAATQPAVDLGPAVLIGAGSVLVLGGAGLVGRPRRARERRQPRRPAGRR